MNTFKSLLTSRTEEYIDEVLAPYFGGIMAFVKEAEMRIEQGSADAYAKHEGERLSFPLAAFCFSSCLSIFHYLISFLLVSSLFFACSLMFNLPSTSL